MTGWTDDKLRAMLERCTYKPSHALTAARGAYEHAGTAKLQVRAMLLDAYRPGKSILVVFERYVPKDLYDDEFGLWLREVIGEFELHERDEWLKVDGQRVHDPHDYS